MPDTLKQKEVPALKVRQWLKGWDNVTFTPGDHRRKPEPFFYIFSLSAVELRKLCGIARRQTAGMTPRAADMSIQRQHDVDRSTEIGRFVEYGYPWSTLSDAKRDSAEFNDLRKPGWLPTAIVINILTLEDERRTGRVDKKDIVSLRDDGSTSLLLPYKDGVGNWKPTSLPPFEVIDGQHRLWAFNDSSDPTFEMPVVAFYGLDISWQAYLFWTINIKPKKINPSLAFDLYPLLRAEDWLERGEGHVVYRETRSQELTEILWSYPDTPWFDKINMLGERQNPWVSQSAWVKSMIATFVKPWKARGARWGGLFGSRMHDEDEVLGWRRAQQAAFLILAWQKLQDAVENSKENWAKALRASYPRKGGYLDSREDAAFYGPHTLIATDQGVRAYLHVLNDLSYLQASKLKLDEWDTKSGSKNASGDDVDLYLKSAKKTALEDFLISWLKDCRLLIGELVQLTPCLRKSGVKNWFFAGVADIESSGFSSWSI